MLKLDFINVGYGDAVFVQELLESGTRYSMLIDSGDLSVGKPYPGSKRISASQFLKRQGISRIDLLVVSHLHLDHTGGLASLLPGITVGELWSNYLPDRALWEAAPAGNDNFSNGANCLLKSIGVFTQALSQMKKMGTRFRFIGHDALVHPFPAGKLCMRISPGKEELLSRQKEIFDHALQGNPDGEELEELDYFINNTSIRVRILYGKRVIDLPGDACGDYWASKSISKCDMMKLPHHGHRDSLTPKLLGELSPEYAVISVSNDRTDDCPSEAILSMLSDADCKVLFTDAVQSRFSKRSFHESVSFLIDSGGNIRGSDEWHVTAGKIEEEA